MFDIELAAQAENHKKNFDSLSPEGLLHLLAEADVRQFDMLGRYYRYDARFERSFFKAWKELKSLQAARQSAPQAGPESVETEEPETQPTDFAKQTQIEPLPPAPTPKPTAEPPAPGEEKGENGDYTL